MASPKPYASVSEESSYVQVLDSDESLVPSTRVRVLDTNKPSVLSCVSSVPDEPVAGSIGVAAGSRGNIPAIASPSQDEDEDIAPAMPSPTRSSGNRISINSKQLSSMWNWRKIFSKLGTLDQCIQFAEERELIPKHKTCSYHRCLMTLSKQSGQVGKFRCRKSNCRTKQVSRAIGTWFENARLSLTLIFQMMYAFSEGLTYHQTRKELICDGPVVSTRTVADWFSYCRETIAIYVLENQTAQGKIGGPNIVVQIDESKVRKRKYNHRRNIEGHWVVGMLEDGSDDLRLEVCPDNEKSVDILVPLIKKHVAESSIIHTDHCRAYMNLSEHGYKHRCVNHSDSTNKFVAPDGAAHTQRMESQWRRLKKQFHQLQNKNDFTYWLCEYSWRHRILIDHLDAYEELLNAIKYVYI